MKNIIESLNWRYATKQYDPSKKVDEADFNNIMEAVRLTPSSYGLPVYKMVLVKNEDLRKALRAAAWDQPQLTDASYVVIFAIKTNIDENLVTDYMKMIADVRSIPVESLNSMKDMISGTVLSMSQEQKISWATHQAYIALGTLLETSAIMEIDATPMEGFDKKQFDKILGLEEKGLQSVVMAAVGYRNPADKFIQMKKVRQPKEDFVVEM